MYGLGEKGNFVALGCRFGFQGGFEVFTLLHGNLSQKIRVVFGVSYALLSGIVCLRLNMAESCDKFTVWAVAAISEISAGCKPVENERCRVQHILPSASIAKCTAASAQAWEEGGCGEEGRKGRKELRQAEAGAVPFLLAAWLQPLLQPMRQQQGEMPGHSRTHRAESPCNQRCAAADRGKITGPSTSC